MATTLGVAGSFLVRPPLPGGERSKFSKRGNSLPGVARLRESRRQCGRVFEVEMEHEGKIHKLQVPEDETILSKALEEGVEVPHDCKLGVCMTCPAKLERGRVNQSEGMLSDDVVEKGYALLCVSYPLENCRIRTIPEDELVSLQLVTSAD